MTRRRSSKTKRSYSLSPNSTAIVVAILGVLASLSLVVGEGGEFTAWVSNLLTFLFGRGAYMVPLSLFALAVIYFNYSKINPIEQVEKPIGIALTTLVGLIILALSGVDSGIIGVTLTLMLVTLFSEEGAALLITLALPVILVLVSDWTIKGMLQLAAKTYRKGR